MEIIKLIAETGGTLGLALFAIWILNKVWTDRLIETKQYAEDIRLLNSLVVSALDRNTEAMTRLVERLENNNKKQEAKT